MNAKSSFAISQFTNPSGEIVFRVSGWLDGKRFRKNFPTRPEAEAERQVLEVCRLQGEAGIHTAATRLTDDQLHEAEMVFRRLSGQAHPLSFYVEFALANYHEPQRQQSLADAVMEYLAVKKVEYEQQIISRTQFASIRRSLAVLQKHFPGVTIGELSAPRLTAYLQHGKVSLKTYNNRRGIISTLLKFALQQDWIIKNPVEKIPYHRIAHRRGSPMAVERPLRGNQNHSQPPPRLAACKNPSVGSVSILHRLHYLTQTMPSAVVHTQVGALKRFRKSITRLADTLCRHKMAMTPKNESAGKVSCPEISNYTTLWQKRPSCFTKCISLLHEFSARNTPSG